jgi:hypothetical protein
MHACWFSAWCKAIFMRKCLELWKRIKFLHAHRHRIVPFSIFIIFLIAVPQSAFFIGFWTFQHIWVPRQHLGWLKALWIITFRYYGNRLSITSQALNLKILPTLKSTWKLNIWAGSDVYFRFKLINCWFWMIKIGIIGCQATKTYNIVNCGILIR